MRKMSPLLCLLVALSARGDVPLPRILCNGVFQGFPASLNFQGASCNGLGGINAITVSTGTAAPATAATVGGLKGNGATTTCSGTDKMTGWNSVTGAMTCAADVSGGVDLSAEPFITKTASALLSNEFALGSLATGILKNTTTTGVPSIAVAGTDYAPATAGGTILLGNGAGAFSNYAGTSCLANQYMNALDTTGVKTCAQVTTAQLSGTVTNAQLASTYSGTGACGAHQWASTLNGNAAPTCTQPAYADVSGTPASLSGAHYVTTQAEASLSAEAVLPTCAPNERLTFDGATISCASLGLVADLSNEPFITSTASANLNNEFALGSLGTGLLINTTTTGIPTAYVGTTCTNSFVRNLDASGNATCFAASLTADVSGILPLANGGTNANLAASNGAVAYSGASALALSGVGTAGQILSSGGAGTPTWIAGPRFIRVSGSNFTTTSTTASTITGLSFSAASSTTYFFQCAVSLSGSATGGPQLRTNYSGTANSIVASITNHTTVATTLLYTGQTTAAGTLTAACTASCLTGNIPFIVTGMLSANGSGTFALQAANSTAGQTTTAFIGSACVYWTP